jgi:hypothetical protein
VRVVVDANARVVQPVILQDCWHRVDRFVDLSTEKLAGLLAAHAKMNPTHYRQSRAGMVDGIVSELVDKIMP